MKAADDQGDRDEVDDDEDQNIREYHPRVADRERRLHELGRHAAREFILVEAQDWPACCGENSSAAAWQSCRPASVA